MKIKALNVLLISAAVAIAIPVQADDAAESTKSAASSALDKTREVGRDVGEASANAWEKVKEVTGKAVDATRENVTKFREYSNEKVCEHSETLCKEDK
ncbi:hypothetical protein ACFQ45_11845 [Rhodanobacter aciditrophus]|uniref:Uncharacterized protein n=1 Tax=Rhodanobacter aciditrophus TaxID=1623218 RepID=A0ABW4B1Y4_9GAMM